MTKIRASKVAARIDGLEEERIKNDKWQHDCVSQAKSHDPNAIRDLAGNVEQRLRRSHPFFSFAGAAFSGIQNGHRRTTPAIALAIGSRHRCPTFVSFVSFCEKDLGLSFNFAPLRLCMRFCLSPCVTW